MREPQFTDWSTLGMLAAAVAIYQFVFLDF